MFFSFKFWLAEVLERFPEEMPHVHKKTHPRMPPCSTVVVTSEQKEIKRYRRWDLLAKWEITKQIRWMKLGMSSSHRHAKQLLRHEYHSPLPRVCVLLCIVKVYSVYGFTRTKTLECRAKVIHRKFSMIAILGKERKIIITTRKKIMTSAWIFLCIQDTQQIYDKR